MKIFQSLRITALAVLVTGLLGSVALAQSSPHRKVDDQGIGNCVFSNQVLGYQKDSSYALKNSFQAPESVYARCYFAKTLGEYQAWGKVESDLRSQGNYRAELYRYPGGTQTRNNLKGGAAANGAHLATAAEYKMQKTSADQQRFDITGAADGDLVMAAEIAGRYGALTKVQGEGNHYIFHLPNYVKAMAETAQTYPYHSTFCLRVYLSIADQAKIEEKYDDYAKKYVKVQKPLYEQRTIAHGCFEYALHSAAQVSWTPSALDKAQAIPGVPSVPGVPALPGGVDEAAKDLLKGLGF